MGYDPATYETAPMPYSGDVASFVMDSGVSPYNPGPDLKEHPATVSTLSQSQVGTSLQAWCDIFNIVPSDTLTYAWYTPNNVLFGSGSFNVPTPFSTASFYSAPLPVGDA
jgi:hypothetical protein